MRAVRSEPARSCLACRRKVEKRRLLRFVADWRGALAIDPEMRAGGRGAYLCARGSCVRDAAKRRLFSRALRREVEAVGGEELAGLARAALRAAVEALLEDGLRDGRALWHRGQRGGAAGGSAGGGAGGGFIVRDGHLARRIEGIASRLEELEAGSMQDERDGRDRPDRGWTLL